MGLFDLLRPRRDQVKTTKTALEAAKDSDVDDGAIGKVTQKLLDFGLDGTGPINSATEVAGGARRDAGGDTEKAIDRVVRAHVRNGGIGGFATSVGAS